MCRRPLTVERAAARRLLRDGDVSAAFQQVLDRLGLACENGVHQRALSSRPGDVERTRVCLEGRLELLHAVGGDGVKDGAVAPCGRQSGGEEEEVSQAERRHS